MVSTLLGAGLGVVGRTRFGLAAAGFALFGVVGLAAASTDPQSNTVTAVLGAALAVMAGLWVLRFLLKVAVGPWRTPAPGTPLNTDPTKRTPDRRQFLAWSGTATAAAAVVGAAGRSIRADAQLSVDTTAIQVPDAATSTATVPADTGIDVEGISSYITPNDSFYRIDTAISIPRIDQNTWSLRIHGLVDEPYELTYDELLSMELVEAPVTIECVSNEVGAGLVGTAVWTGVPLQAILDRAGLQADATQIVGRSVDGFTIGMPTDVALDGRTALVAVTMNGEPLPLRNGFPARLIVAGLYGYVSATKWLTELELVRWEDFDAYWVPRGWSKEGPIKIDSRIDVPRIGQALTPGPIAIGGVAWHPDIGVEAVEIRIDGGEWRRARLGESANDDTWVQWVYEWEGTSGEHLIESRAIGRNGDVQIEQRAPVAPDGATGYHRRLARIA